MDFLRLIRLVRHFTILLPARIGHKSAAVTMYAAGPSPDPWIILAVTAEIFDTSLANIVECVWLLSQLRIQL